MLSILKAIGGPGSIGFLGVGCAAGLAWRAAGYPRFGRAWLLILYFSYVVAGMPIVANGFASAASSYRPIEDLSRLGTLDLIVVLHGDNVRGRIRETRRLFEAAHGGPPVLVSGDQDFADAVVAGGIPADRVLLDNAPINTFEQIAGITRFVRERQARRPVLIASRLQMPRVAELLRSAGADHILLAPAEIDDEPPAGGVRLFVPAYIGLRVTRDAIYELLAMRDYRQRGLIDLGTKDPTSNNKR